jgi:hypothetical protein
MDPRPPLKFPPLRPPPGAASEVRGLPTPAGYRRGMPLIGAPDTTLPAPRSERKRRLAWFGVAVGLHAALGLGFWLLPPLRLKWNPPAEDWVPVVSLPTPAAAPMPAAAPVSTAPARPVMSGVTKSKTRIHAREPVG